MKKIEIFLKNILLRLLLIWGSKKKHIQNVPISNILLIRLNRIGDALVTTPFINQLRNNFEGKIYLLASKSNFFVFNNNPSLDEVIIFNKGLKSFIDVINFVNKKNINTIIDLHDDVSTTVSFILALCNAKNKFGLEKNNNLIYTKTVPKLNSSQNHVVKRNLEILKLLNIQPDFDNAKIFFYPSQDSYKKVDDFLAKNFNRKKFLVGINISAGSMARFWGINNFKLLLNYLYHLDLEIILLSAPENFELANQITDRQIIFSSKNYEEFGAIISKLNLLITPDTAAVHLASAFNVPVFGIYVKYKTHDMIWSPLGCKFDCVITTEPNLKNVSYPEVKNKLEMFLKKILIN